MPKQSDTAVPSYRHRKPSGQGVVTLNGQDVYLGRYNTAASIEAYSRRSNLVGS